MRSFVYLFLPPSIQTREAVMYLKFLVFLVCKDFMQKLDVSMELQKQPHSHHIFKPCIKDLRSSLALQHAGHVKDIIYVDTQLGL